MRLVSPSGRTDIVIVSILCGIGSVLGGCASASAPGAYSGASASSTAGDAGTTGDGSVDAGVADAGTPDVSTMLLDVVDAGVAVEAGTPQSGDIVVNPTVPHQTIDGFGAADVYTPGGALTPTQVRLFFDPVNGIGLSILRIGIDVTGTPLGASTLADVQSTAPYGVLVWAAPWSPPGGDKDNGTQDDGGHLCASAGQGSCSGSNYDAWANVLAAFPAMVKAQTGVSLYGISAQNEPDYTATYASCLYTASQMVSFVKVLGPKLAALNPPVRLIAAESESWSHLWTGTDCNQTYNYGTCIHQDPAADTAVAIYATHDYGFGPVPSPSWLAKPLWETEVSGLGSGSQGVPSVDISNGIAVAQWIYNALVTGGASAWHYWWLVNQATNKDNEGLIFATGQGPNGVGDITSPPKRLYTVGNFSKFVRPGYQRIDVSGPVPAGVQIAGFRSPANGTVAIVAINSTTSAAPVSLFVAGAGWPAAVTPWVTSATANLASSTAVALAGGRFSATLGPQTVTTFVGTP
jgi:glucuronoarabinoxylan endo-1,4-beta-xylanase